MTVSLKYTSGKADIESMRAIVSGIAHKVSHIYTDGGLCGGNPSDAGGAWAVVLVDSDDNQVFEACGIIPATPDRTLECNVVEQIAMTVALEIMPDKWTGFVCSDSQNAIGRTSKNWETNGVPSAIMQRCYTARDRLGKLTFEQLKGHPRKKDRERGYGENGRRVSIHNETADKLCSEMTRERMVQLMSKAKPVQQPLFQEHVDPWSVILMLLYFAPKPGRKPRKSEAEKLAEVPDTLKGQARMVFNLWREVNKKCTLESDKILNMIIGRLKEGYTVPQLCQASIGILFSPHHQGHNTNGLKGQGIKYNDPKYVFEDSEKVGKWIDKAEENGYSQIKVSQMINGTLSKVVNTDNFVNKMTGEGMK